MTRTAISSRAFCLHARPYRESSMIVQLFSEQVGRFSAVVKGVKSSARKNAAILPLLQPFVPLQISWTGKSELKTLSDIERHGDLYSLSGPALFAGLYVNEVLVRLLSEHIEYPEIYRDYQTALQGLQQTADLEAPLRQFEMRLLENLGYGVPFVEVDSSGHSVGVLQASANYQFVHESGFVRRPSAAENVPLVFSGERLLKMANDDFREQETATQAKHLMRLVMKHLLGDKPLNSKTLFS